MACYKKFILFPLLLLTLSLIIGDGVLASRHLLDAGLPNIPELPKPELPPIPTIPTLPSRSYHLCQNLKSQPYQSPSCLHCQSLRSQSCMKYQLFLSCQSPPCPPSLSSQKIYPSSLLFSRPTHPVLEQAISSVWHHFTCYYLVGNTYIMWIQVIVSGLRLLWGECSSAISTHLSFLCCTSYFLCFSDCLWSYCYSSLLMWGLIFCCSYNLSFQWMADIVVLFMSHALEVNGISRMWMLDWEIPCLLLRWPCYDIALWITPSMGGQLNPYFAMKRHLLVLWSVFNQSNTQVKFKTSEDYWLDARCCWRLDHHCTWSTNRMSPYTNAMRIIALSRWHLRALETLLVAFLHG